MKKYLSAIFLSLATLAATQTAFASGASLPKKADYDVSKLVGQYTTESCIDETLNKSSNQGVGLDIVLDTETSLHIRPNNVTFPTLDLIAANINMPESSGHWTTDWNNVDETNVSFTVANGLFHRETRHESPKVPVLGDYNSYESRYTLTDTGDGKLQYVIDLDLDGDKLHYTCTLAR